MMSGSILDFLYELEQSRDQNSTAGIGMRHFTAGVSDMRGTQKRRRIPEEPGADPRPAR
jgi:hypothetical protein